MKKKILFMIPTLGHGGAEKVLVNLVNHMNCDKYDITVMTLYDGGVNKQFLNGNIKYYSGFKRPIPGIGHILKFFSPAFLYRRLINERYDVIISYLEGQTARIVSACPDEHTKLIAWVHVEQHTEKRAATLFRAISEMKKCYRKFDKIIAVSEYVKKDFSRIVSGLKSIEVLYNTVESDAIRKEACIPIEDVYISEDEFNICGVGTLKPSKGFDRLLRIHEKLRKEGYPVHCYILGEGKEEARLKKMAEEAGISSTVTFLGYKTNPYKYIKKCDLMVCTSFAEGFSTAVTESLIVGTPVCTVEVSGMKELLGYNNEFGIVTKNDEDELYYALKELLDNKKRYEYYKNAAYERGKIFSTERTVEAVENMINDLFKSKRYDLEYSVIIRTTGNAHEKYQKLLNSIAKLNIQPKEVIVVLPEGYDIPKEKLGNEKFYFSPKGMVIQRMVGIERCKTKYALVCDDDVCFDGDFVEKLYEPILLKKCSFSAGPLYSFLPRKGGNSILAACMGNAAPTLFHKDRYNTVLRTGGYSYNRYLDSSKRRFYETQSAAWTCFFADISALKMINFEDEKWLDANGYSYLDDQTMFYKGYLLGYKTMIVPDAKYTHLDGKTSKLNNRPAALYSTNFNRVIFWHRFLYNLQKKPYLKFWTKCCFYYRAVWIMIYDFSCVIRKRMTYADYKTSINGLRDGFSFIKCAEYKDLPKI